MRSRRNLLRSLLALPLAILGLPVIIQKSGKSLPKAVWYINTDVRPELIAFAQNLRLPNPEVGGKPYTISALGADEGIEERIRERLNKAYVAARKNREDR